MASIQERIDELKMERIQLSKEIKVLGELKLLQEEKQNKRMAFGNVVKKWVEDGREEVIKELREENEELKAKLSKQNETPCCVNGKYCGDIDLSQWNTDNCKSTGDNGAAKTKLSEERDFYKQENEKLKAKLKKKKKLTIQEVYELLIDKLNKDETIGNERIDPHDGTIQLTFKPNWMK